MTNGNTTALSELQAIAAEAFAVLDTGHQISPFSARFSAFDLDEAYRVTAAIRQMREMPVGRKIGSRIARFGPNMDRSGDTFTTARYTTSPRSAIRSRSWVSLSHE